MAEIKQSVLVNDFKSATDIHREYAIENHVEDEKTMDTLVKDVQTKIQGKLI